MGFYSCNMSETTTTVTTTTTDAGNDWTFSLCSCCQNGFCDFLGKYFCAMCQYGRAMEIALGKSCIVCCLFGGFCRCCNRREVRDKYSIQGSDCNDCLMCTFCALCSMMQVM